MTTSTGVGESAAAAGQKTADRGDSGSKLRAVLDALASPLFTVPLILAAIAIVMLGTLAQVQADIWEVVKDYFRSWIAWVDLKVLFPPTFFPWAATTDWSALPVKSFPFPGGALIGSALVVNLVAAHLVRFRVRARGARLVVGLIVLLAGMAVTWAVIQTGHNRQGVQGEPWLAWSTLWVILKFMLVGLFLSSVAGVVYVLTRVRRQRTIELVLLVSSALVLGTAMVWVFVKGDAAVLTDSSLRILYHLIQGEVAALALLAGCVVLFRKGAGMALLHGGLGLMMFGEFFVSQYAEEQQMTLLEGQTVSHTQDIRSAEIAITSMQTSGRASVVTIPTETYGKTTRFIDGGPIPLEGLPFEIEVIRYFRNSTMRPARPGEQSPATRGTGMEFIAEEAPPESGVQSRKIDLASAYVKVIDPATKKDVGTLLLSQHFPARRMLSNTVNVANKVYGLELRFKRSQKPYQITLLDVRKDDYVGTSMARNYASRVRLRDPSRGVEFETKIWMNNPLRYAGETFYQSGYRAGASGETSTLQVVKNTGWMIPYVSCMIVATGMLAHFVLLLLKFLRRGQGGDEENGPEIPKAELPQLPLAQNQELPVAWRWCVPLAIVALAAIYVVVKAVPGAPGADEMNLVEFGKIPVMFEGRVKPTETLARNSLRILSNRETFKDARGRRQPAVSWLLDVIARPEVAEEHCVFRIDNLDLLNSMNLERRKGFRYSWLELRERSREFQELVLDARKQDAQTRTLPQRKVLQLLQRVERFRLLSDAFRPSNFPPFPTEEEIEENPQLASRRLAAITRMTSGVESSSRSLAARHPPLIVPTDSEEEPWRAYASAKNEDYVDRNLRQQPADPAVGHLASIFEACTSDRPEEFNDAVSDYRLFLAGESREGLDLKIADFEAFFNRFAPFYHTIPIYGFALLLTTMGWLASAGWPRVAELLRSSGFWLIVLAFAVHTFALAARVIISGRPPVTNLYSSAVFVGWGCVAIGLLLELVSRLGIGNLVAAVSGIGTLIVAHFLAADGDTIRVLQAVLDTQFWLTVHVLTVTLGYSATFLAGLLGIFTVIYLLFRPLVTRLGASRRGNGRVARTSGDLPEQQVDAAKILGGMMYGTICFAALFSLVGTVLGGLWADDSWGRFWGWDPKENGALMVVLWNALVLHVRSAHLVKERGLAILAIGGNIITAWSWFGVNELGVGLHSYGFTEGVSRTLWIFWISQLVLMGVGLVLYLIEKTVGHQVDAPTAHA